MRERTYWSWPEYLRGLPLRVLLFALLGLGWDVLMTFLQMLLSTSPPGVEVACPCMLRLGWSAHCPASVWMLLAYGGIPLLVYPVTQLGKWLGLTYRGRTVLVLGVFYAVEYGFGTALRRIHVTAWDYRWFLKEWSPDGLVCWHPLILVAWLVFCGFIEVVDEGLRRGYPALRAAFRDAWRAL